MSEQTVHDPSGIAPSKKDERRLETLSKQVSQLMPLLGKVAALEKTPQLLAEMPPGMFTSSEYEALRRDNRTRDSRLNSLESLTNAHQVNVRAFAQRLATLPSPEDWQFWKKTVSELVAKVESLRTEVTALKAGKKVPAKKAAEAAPAVVPPSEKGGTDSVSVHF